MEEFIGKLELSGLEVEESFKYEGGGNVILKNGTTVTVSDDFLDDHEQMDDMIAFLNK